MTSDPAEQSECAQAYSRANYPEMALAPRHRAASSGKLRIAYVSADFHEHAVATLIAELIEIHDRDRFSIFGISLGPARPGAMRSRLETAFDHFVDVCAMSDREAAEVMRNLEVDIAIDLTGHTHDARTGIFAFRPAPIQVNFLGYTGTMGANFIDYIVADSIVIPPGSDRYYTEKVVRLPYSFQVNDSTRRIAASTPTRAELGLPENDFVFCCFNSSFKIRAAMFDVWMGLLQRVDRSVLWMLDAGNTVKRNLREEAQRRGVAGSRLVFAPRVPQPEHLARQRAADLFVDSLPYNAHTGTSDALWAGLPVLTCPGETFASRVAASLLLAINVPDLIAPTLAAYEDRALRLATSPPFLDQVRRQIAANRATAPLFDTDRFRQQIENAYLTMWDIHQRGLAPRAFSVQGS